MKYRTRQCEKTDRLVGAEVQTYEAPSIEEAVEHLREDVSATWGKSAAQEVDESMLEAVAHEIEYARVITESHDVQQVVDAINDTATDYGAKPHELAAQYAIKSQTDSGYPIDEDAIYAHLKTLQGAGAQFDEKAALEYAIGAVE
jgi:ribosomal protein S25